MEFKQLFEMQRQLDRFIEETQNITKDDRLTTTEKAKNKHIPIPEHVEPEPKKRGFLSRFFLPNG